MESYYKASPALLQAPSSSGSAILNIRFPSALIFWVTLALSLGVFSFLTPISLILIVNTCRFRMYLQPAFAFIALFAAGQLATAKVENCMPLVLGCLDTDGIMQPVDFNEVELIRRALTDCENDSPNCGLQKISAPVARSPVDLSRRQSENTGSSNTNNNGNLNQSSNSNSNSNSNQGSNSNVNCNNGNSNSNSNSGSYSMSNLA